MARWFLFLFLVIGSMLSCKAPPGSPEQPMKNISCVGEAVARNWSVAYPHVMKCLTGIMESPMNCLDAVPNLAAATMDTVACIVRYAGREAAMQAQKGDHDIVTVRKAERAQAWLDSRGFTFE